MAAHDLVIRNGEVIDGTGGPRRHADIAISDGVVTDVAEPGTIAGSGTSEIDADGAQVIPGIVDIHAHYDGQATWESRLQPSSWHGVTTVVMGNCGVGFAPLNDGDQDRLIELMEGVEDIPGTALHEGLSWDWRSFAEFLDAVDAKPHDLDVAAQVPHGALRLHAMGQRAGHENDATTNEIATMAEQAREAILAGALGFTTSRTRNHRASTGEYTPTLTAAPDELIGIAEAVGSTGAGVLQVVSDLLDVDDEFSTMRSMVERSGRPLSLSVVRNPMLPDHYRDVLDHITKANEAGLQVTGQVAPRAVGLIFGFELTLNPFLTNAVYREIADQPFEAKITALTDPTFRQRLLDEDRAGVERSGDKLGGRLIHRFDLLFELGDDPDYEPSLDQSMTARAARNGTTPEEEALDVLLADGGHGMLYLPFLNYVDGRLDACSEMLAHPYTVPGLGDGGAHVGTICDGSFPTTLLQYWGRDRANGQLDLEFLVHRQCQRTAQTVGLDDRGVIAPGYRADLNVIDHAGMRVHKPTVAYDLPAGGRRLLQRADGWLHTIVAGRETYRAGEATGELPGRLVRGAQAAPAGA